MKLTRRQTGFTLIEVLLVVIIMAIITTGAFSGMLNLQRTSRINAMSRQFSSFLEIARSYSLNGKLINTGCEPSQIQCVPQSFGVIFKAVDAAKCPSKLSVDLIYQKLNAPNFLDPNAVTMDSFCTNSKVDLWYSYMNGAQQKLLPGTDIFFAYTPPFGTFSTTSQTTTPQKVTLTFCEAATGAQSCNPNSYSKVLTLYTNVGVIE